MHAPLPPKATTSSVIDGEALPNIAEHVLIRRIGKGAYGEVWLARNAIGSLRAVKVVKRSTFADEGAYQREFKGLRSFEPISRNYAGFVQILQVGENAAAGYFYYVMELADDVKTGQRIAPNAYVPRTLTHELAKPGRLPLETSLPIGLALAAGLAHLHAHMFIHRDIKPSNIIFVRGVPKLADIGLITEAGPDVSACGTLNYMPPELPGQPTGDIFSLGKVFYGLFMGMPCERFPDPPAAAEEFTTNPALRQLNNLILKACHHDPAQRFQTAHELHEELVSVSETVQGRPRSTGAALPPGGVAAGKTPRTPEGPSGPNGEERPKARWPRMAALLVLLLAIGGAVFVAMKRPDGTTGDRPQTKSPTAPTNSPPPIPAATHPVFVLMDTTAPRGVYDQDNIPKGRSNADELYTKLAGLDGIVLQKNLFREGIGLDFARDSVVAAQRPDIVIIHRSSFFHPFAAQLNLDYPTFADDADGEKLRKWQALYDSQDARLRSLIRAVGAASPHTQFLIYSTGTDQRWTKPEFQSNWVHTLEVELPDLEGRINTMFIEPQPDGKKGTFRDPATMEKVRERVRKMIKKWERLKSQKPN